MASSWSLHDTYSATVDTVEVDSGAVGSRCGAWCSALHVVAATLVCALWLSSRWGAGAQHWLSSTEPQSLNPSSWMQRIKAPATALGQPIAQQQTTIHAITAGRPTDMRLHGNALPNLAALVESPACGPGAWLALAGMLGVLFLALKKLFDTPSRKYNPNDVNVGREYDAWTEEGVLEYYWGEHIHLGYYSPELRRRGNYSNLEFIEAKVEFVNKMFDWSGAKGPRTILDVGCGIGGTSRQLAERLPAAQVTGITLSPKQVERGMELVKERGIKNCELKVMDALKMDFPDNSFDLVWGCESGEHMPDKKKYVEEMVRVLKPGGTLVIATWCQREETPEKPFTQKEKGKLQFLYDEWAHPYFISKEAYVRIMHGTGQLECVGCEDWNEYTIDSWRHSIWVGVRDPMGLFCKGPAVLYKCLRDAITLEKMHRAFACGLMEYGMLKAKKKSAQASPQPVPTSEAAALPSSQ
eukprot:GGOE01001753.1.p1 GENE.GGOE01001753.1~~GGOE01001753.1.p1  ORF type:complete len:480 (+),score=119.09 GGOE01001753.1:38-1441(+)